MIRVHYVEGPAFLASALINGDESGFDNDGADAATLARFLDYVAREYGESARIVSTKTDPRTGESCESYFAERILLLGVWPEGVRAGDVLEYVVHVDSPLPGASKSRTLARFYDRLTRWPNRLEYGARRYALVRDALMRTRYGPRGESFFDAVDSDLAEGRAYYSDDSDSIFGDASDIARGYVEAALFCGVEYPSGDPRSDSDRANDLNPSDIEPESLLRMIRAADAWAEKYAALIERATEAGINRGGGDHSDAEQIGHDLWLTSNGHGAGFWDGDYNDGADGEDIGDALTDAARELGESSLSMGRCGVVQLD